MKKHILSYAFAAFAALSCSSMASLQTQVYDDGLYTRPAVAAAPAEAVPVPGEEVDNLLAMSKQSPAYILSEGDTLVVPAGSEVRFRNNSAVLAIVDTTLPSWTWDYSWYYGPRWAWDPWYYDSWYYRPWHLRPWHYYGYHWSWSPWYYGPSWAWDPWYYDPWYYDSWHFRHHYYGYYGYGYHGYSHWYGRPGFYHVNRHLYGPENNGRQSVARKSTSASAFGGATRSSSVSRGGGASRSSVSR